MIGSVIGKINMLLHFSHIGFVFHLVYCLATLLFLSVLYILTFVLGSATSPVSDVVKMLTGLQTNFLHWCA